MSKHYSVHIYLFYTADVEGSEGGCIIKNKDKSRSPDTCQPVKDAPESEWTECNFSLRISHLKLLFDTENFNMRIHCKNLHKYF